MTMNTEVRNFTQSWLSGGFTQSWLSRVSPGPGHPRRVNEGAGQGQGACDMTADHTTIISPGRLVWPDGSAIAVGQGVRCVIAQSRYAGKMATISSLNPCHPDPATCSRPSRHDEIGVDGVGSSSAWFRTSELEVVLPSPVDHTASQPVLLVRRVPGTRSERRDGLCRS